MGFLYGSQFISAHCGNLIKLFQGYFNYNDYLMKSREEGHPDTFLDSVITAFRGGLPRRRRDAKGNEEQAVAQREKRNQGTGIRAQRKSDFVGSLGLKGERRGRGAQRGS